MKRSRKEKKVKGFWKQSRAYIFRGVLASMPLALSVVVILFIYKAIDKQVQGLTDQFIGFRLPGLGILILLVVFYLIGLIASNVVGRRFFQMIEQIINKLPIVKTTYQVGKQVANTLSLPEKQVFKKAVLLCFFQPEAWVIGFVTGNVTDEASGEMFLKVFVPTVPNPTSGYLAILKEAETIDPGWSVEQAMKMVISGGIIGPDQIQLINHKTHAKV